MLHHAKALPAERGVRAAGELLHIRAVTVVCADNRSAHDRKGHTVVSVRAERAVFVQYVAGDVDQIVRRGADRCLVAGKRQFRGRSRRVLNVLRNQVAGGVVTIRNQRSHRVRHRVGVLILRPALRKRLLAQRRSVQEEFNRRAVRVQPYVDIAGFVRPVRQHMNHRAAVPHGLIHEVNVLRESAGVHDAEIAALRRILVPFGRFADVVKARPDEMPAGTSAA